jgi:hypothetical protein
MQITSTYGTRSAQSKPIAERANPTNVRQTPFNMQVDATKAWQTSTDTKAGQTSTATKPAVANTGDPKIVPVSLDTKPNQTTTGPDILKRGGGAKALEDSPDGKIDHKVEKDEYLNEIARYYGVTLDDLKTSNPSLFPPGRNPDIIHPGETVIVLDKTRRGNAVAMKDAVDKAHAEQAKLDKMKHDMGASNYSRLRRANPDIEDGVKQAWAKVREMATEEMYYAGAESRTPIDGVDSTAKDIASRFPGDADVAGQVDAAKAAVTRVWTATGRTGEVQNKLTSLTDNVNKAKASGQGVDQAQKELRDYLVKLLTDAKTNNAGSSDPMVRLAGILAQSDAARGAAPPEDVLAQQLLKEAMMPADERAVRSEALVLSAYGPDDPAFRAAVEAAQKKILVDDPAKAVADAYASGGPGAAAAKLKQVTGRDVATEDTASAIMHEAMPTVQKIADDVGTFEKTSFWQNATDNYTMPSQYSPSIPIKQGDRLWSSGPAMALEEQIFADLSSASDHAFYGQGGTEVVHDVAAAIIGQVPDWQATGLDNRLLYQSVAGGEGAALQLEIVKQVRDSGHPDVAADLMKRIAEGVKLMPENIGSAVEAFTGNSSKEGSGQEFINLVTDWTGKLSDAQLNRAIQAYIDKHPDTIKQMQADLDKIGVAGYTSVQFQRAWDVYKGDLQGVKNADRVDETVTDMKNDKGAVGFARSSPVAVQELAREDLASLDIIPGQAFLQPASLLRGLAKSSTAGVLKATADVNTIKPNTKAGIFTNGPASLLAGGASYLLLAHSGSKSTTEYLYGGFFGVASLKEGVEFTSGLAVARSWASEHGLVGRIGKAEAPNWARFSKGFGTIGAGIDFYAAAVTAGKGGWENYVSAGLSATSGIAGVVTLFGVGGPVPGIVATVAVLLNSGFNWWRNVERSNRYEGPTEQFLIDAGLRPEIAKQLSNHDGDGVSAAARLGPLAKHLGISEQELVSWLDDQDAKFVGDFVKDALHPAKADNNGNYKESNPGGEISFANAPGGRGGFTQILDVTPDGKFIVEVNGRQSTKQLTMDGLPSRIVSAPESMKGIEIWAQLDGHPLPRA